MTRVKETITNPIKDDNSLEESVVAFRQSSYNRKFLVSWNARMSHENVEPLYDKVIIAILKQQNVDIEYVPQNLYQPQKLFDALNSYDPECAFKVDFKDPFVRAGRNLSFSVFAKPSSVGFLRPIRLDQDWGILFKELNIKGSASAGLTALGLDKAESFSIAMRKVPEVLSGKAPDPCLAYARTQKGKVRLIWGYPFVMTILEGCIARPIINYFLHDLTTPIAFGKRSASMGLDIRKAESHNDYYVGLDASQFDSTVPAGIIRSAFSALRTWYDPSDEVGFGYTVKDVFDIVEHYFIYTPIVMPTVGGPVLFKGKKSGVPSGSYFTQLIDSFQNVAMLGALSKRFHLNLRRDEFWVLGDDSLFFLKKLPNLQAYSDFLRATFGMKMNTKKAECGSSSEPKHFLGRSWENGLPYKDFATVVKWAVAPEHYRKYVVKDRDAKSVLHSHRNVAFIRGAPPGFYDLLPYVPVGTRAYGSGYHEFLLREGLIPSQPSITLF